jgi:uncharacterized protein (TIGR04255 family)
VYDEFDPDSAMTQGDLHFDHAPIVEAIIGIELPTLDDEQMERVRGAWTSVSGEYPESEPLKYLHLEIGVPPPAEDGPQHASRLDSRFGLKLVSADKRQLAIFRRNGFSFSRLPPYERWDSFRSEAKRLWEVYRGAAGTSPVLNFGLRYINRIFIPLGEPMEEFLTLYPHMPNNPDGSPPRISASYMRIDSIIEDLGGQAIIQQGTLPLIKEGFATLSLDFDLRFNVPQQVSDDYVWDVLESARHIKNRLFVGSFKPEFLETFR